MARYHSKSMVLPSENMFSLQTHAARLKQSESITSITSTLLWSLQLILQAKPMLDVIKNSIMFHEAKSRN